MKELPNYLRVSAYDNIGLAVAKHGLVMTVPEILQKMAGKSPIEVKVEQGGTAQITESEIVNQYPKLLE